jgi:hypothetical protein
MIETASAFSEFDQVMVLKAAACKASHENLLAAELAKVLTEADSAVYSAFS